MKKNWCIYILLIMLGLTTIPACDDDDEDPAATYKDWKEQNEAFINQLTYNTDYEKIEDPSKMGYIYMYKMVTNENARRVMYTDTLKIYYQGSLINDSIFDEGYMPKYQSPFLYPVKNYTPGFAAALQNMHEGDSCVVWIPQELAYGASGSKVGNTNVYSILPYSALRFAIKVEEIVNER